MRRHFLVASLCIFVAMSNVPAGAQVGGQSAQGVGAEDASGAPVFAFLAEDRDSSDVSTSLDLMVAHDDGSVTGPLDPRDTFAFEPDVSPDGSQIAFGAQTSPRVPGTTTHSIFVVGPDGAGLVPIYTTQDAIVTYPEWAPDGNRILFSYIPLIDGSREGAGNSDLWVLERVAAGAPWTARPFITRPGTEIGADFSPDGRSVVYAYQHDDDRMNDFEKWNPPSALWVAPADGSSKGHRITSYRGGPGEPTFSPDGSKIAYITYREREFFLHTIRPNGTGLRTLTSGANWIYDPAFTPDGRRVAYSLLSAGRMDSRILTISMSGRKEVLIDLPGSDSSPSFFPKA